MLVSELIEFLDDNNFKKVGVFVVEHRLRTLLSDFSCEDMLYKNTHIITPNIWDDFSFNRVKEMNGLIILQYKGPTDKETHAKCEIDTYKDKPTCFINYYINPKDENNLLYYGLEIPGMTWFDYDE